MSELLRNNCESKSPYYRKLIEYGCEISSVKDESTGEGFYRIVTPMGVSWLSGGNASYPFNSEKTYFVATNKRLMYMLADDLKVRSPGYRYYKNGDSLRELVTFCESLDWNVIVKPNDAHDARGLTLDIGSVSDLEKALTLASESSKSGVILVQQKIDMEEYRFTVYKGSVVSVLRRRVMRFVGDGARDLREMLEYENNFRSEKNKKYDRIVTPELDLAILGGQDDRVPKKGEIVIVGKSDKVLEGGGLLEEVLNEVDYTYLEIACKIADEIGGHFVAVDMFINNPSVSAADDGYYFNEVNTAPASFYYYAARGADNDWIVDRLAKDSIETIDMIGGQRG